VPCSYTYFHQILCIHKHFFTYYHRKSQKSCDVWYCSLKPAYLKATYDNKMTTDYTVQRINGCEGSSPCKDLKNATFVTLITYAVP
jgi:hypothetical protein